MITVLVNYQVNDFGVWVTQFDQHESIRIMEGVKLLNMYHATDDSNSITVLFLASSMDAVKNVFENPTLQKELREAGAEKIEIQILNKLLL